MRLTVPPELRIDEEALAELCPKLGIKLVALFGSRAQGRARADSDWDLAVLVGRGSNPRDAAFALQEALQEQCTGGRLDVSPLNNASPIFAGLVAKYGRPLYQERGAEWLQFVSLSLRRFEDDAKWHRARERWLWRLLRSDDRGP